MKPDDPVSQGAPRTTDHLNDDHPEALLDMARAIGGCPQATAARSVDADRTGLDFAKRAQEILGEGTAQPSIKAVFE